jgi:16S rRNA (cytosine1402-N4)-methyltransferase
MHISVLLNESIEGLNILENGIYVDATLGYAGHSSEILKRIKKGFLFAIDQDSDAIKYSNEKLSKISDNYEIIHTNFKNIKEELNKRNINEVDGILFDLGVSSVQLDDAERGFSYHSNAKLDMRMDKEAKFSAIDVVNNYSEKDLIRILRDYGEEKYANSIARNIVRERSNKKIETTFELADIISKSVPMKAKRDKHPARKTFQAIRIEVNHELDILEDTMKDALSLLKPGGRLVVITFHSLEDRIVKNVFKDYTEMDEMVKGLPLKDIPKEYRKEYVLINKKVIVPTEEELLNNNRSRSAKLRIIERIKN